MAVKTFAVGELVTASDANTYLANSGLDFVKSQTIGSGVSSVTVTGAFSSTWDAYNIVVTGGNMSAGDYGINMRLGSTTTGYYYTGTYLTFGNVGSWIGASNAAEWGAVGIATTNTLYANVIVHNPNLTKNSYFQSDYIYGHPAGGRANMAGYLADNTAYTSFTLFVNASSFAGGTITVYGYRKA